MSPNIPVPMSAIGIGTTSGGPSSSPLIDMRPDMPWAIRSNPPRDAYGPVWPNPEIEQ